MHLVRFGIKKLDNGKNKVVRLVERIENLVAGNGDGWGTGNAPLHFNKTQFACSGNATFDVVAKLFKFPIGGVKTESALDLHDDCSCAGSARLGVGRGAGHGFGVARHGVNEANRHYQHAAKHHGW